MDDFLWMKNSVIFSFGQWPYLPARGLLGGLLQRKLIFEFSRQNSKMKYYFFTLWMSKAGDLKWEIRGTITLKGYLLVFSFNLLALWSWQEARGPYVYYPKKPGFFQDDDEQKRHLPSELPLSINNNATAHQYSRLDYFLSYICQKWTLFCPHPLPSTAWE